MVRFPLLLASALLSASLAFGQASVRFDRVRAQYDGLTRETPRETSFTGMEYVRQGLSLSNGLVRYAVSAHAYWDPKSEVTKPSPEGYLGMPAPTACNWYHSGFMQLSVNGVSLGTVRPASVRVVEEGARGLVEVLWKTTEGQVRVRFLLEPAADYLACEIATQPVKEMKSLEVSLRCYPSAFKRDGWRQVIGSVTKLEQDENKPLNAAQDPWLLYQDRVYDVASNAVAAGPCAMMCLPEQIKELQVGVGSYAVATSVTVKPEVRAVRLAFWEYPKKSNAAALALLKQTTAQVTDRLRKLDFGDSRVAAFDPAKEKAELEAMIGRTASHEKWRQKLLPIWERVAQARAASQGADFGAEKTASEALNEYREAVWELRFDALLSD